MDELTKAIREAAKDLAMDSAHIPIIAGIIERHVRPALTKNNVLDGLDRLEKSEFRLYPLI